MSHTRTKDNPPSRAATLFSYIFAFNACQANLKVGMGLDYAIATTMPCEELVHASTSNSESSFGYLSTRLKVYESSRILFFELGKRKIHESKHSTVNEAVETLKTIVELRNRR